MDRQIIILSTKDLRAASQQTAAQKGIRLDIKPFIRIEYVAAPELITGYERITAIFTSVHAVKAYASVPATARPEIIAVYCIEGTTEREVKRLMPDVPVLASRPYAAELVRDMVQQYSSSLAPLLFFCGDQRMPTIPEGLRQAGIDFEERVVYHTIACPERTDADYDGILFFSPSAVYSFFSLNTLPEHTVAFAIGNTTAGALQPYTDHIVIAAKPDEEVLVDCVLEYCKNIKK
jgi:uroporphyrinogen-III synthase